MAKGEDKAGVAPKDAAAPVTITFNEGYPVDGKPHCYVYNSGGTQVKFTLNEPAGANCHYYATVTKLGGDGSLGGSLETVLPPLPGHQNQTVTVYLDGAPNGCEYFLLVITIQCDGMPTRFVVAKDFRICYPNCS